MKKAISILVVLTAAAVCGAEEVRIAPSVALTYDSHPDGSYIVAIGAEKDALPHVQFDYKAQNPRDDVSITLHINEAGPEFYRTEAGRTALLTRYCELYVGESAEKRILIERYDSPSGAEVLYCSFTDPSLANAKTHERGKFKIAVAALAISGDYEFTALGLINDVGGRSEDIFLRTMTSFHIQDGT